jgi:hypothetical protein
MVWWGSQHIAPTVVAWLSYSVFFSCRWEGNMVKGGNMQDNLNTFMNLNSGTNFHMPHFC